ncbi:MAG TPA: ABC transporter permease [Vicinamibacterales bacterium]|nr:ABC transporter permease [Vicinamibacterales bacterium]
MLADLRLAVRRLRQAPGFTAMAVATLALAIGANTAVLSIADAVLFRPLPYRDPGSLYLLRTIDSTSGRRTATVARDAVDRINQHHRGLGEVGERGSAMIVPHTEEGQTEHMSALTVGANYFPVLGIAAVRGRLFTPTDLSDPGGRAVLSYSSWQRRFGGDEATVGRAVRLGSRNREVIGVLPEGFIFPAEYILFPYGVSGAPEYITLSPPLPARARGRPVVNPIVRLEPRVTREQAQAELDALLEADTPAGGSFQRVMIDDIREVVFPVERWTMGFLVAAAVLVLLLGSANLANMFLARGRRREHEIGVCVALGATRARVVRPVIFEALVIALAGSAVALAVTVLAFDALARQVPPLAYGMARVGPDLRVAAYALALAFAGGLLFGAIPAWQLSRHDALGLLRRSAPRLRGKIHGRVLVGAQVALAVVLAFGAAIAVRGFISALAAPLGFEPRELLTVEVRANARDSKEVRAFYVRALERLAARDDVVAVGAIHALPLSGSAPYTAARAATDGPEAGVFHVLPGYFETLGLRLVRGRFLSWNDFSAGGDVAVLSESTARILFPDGDAIGGRLSTPEGRVVGVVGVVSDVHTGFHGDTRPPVYMLDDGKSGASLALVARMRSREGGALVDIRREIGRLAPGAPVAARWWADSINSLNAYRNPRFQTLVLSSFAALALMLTALGTFAAVAALVAELTREIGIRIAIGASPRSVVRLIGWQVMSAVIAGSLVGLLATWWIWRVAEAKLHQVEAADPGALVLSFIVVLAAAGLAAYIPARRAGRINPITVLRAE